MPIASQKRTSTTDYANAVVNKLLKSRSRRFYIGEGSWIAWFASTYVPHTVLVSPCYKSHSTREAHLQFTGVADDQDVGIKQASRHWTGVRLDYVLGRDAV
jgi:hypothetical protein